MRSHLPWPLRWAVVAIALGFSAALAMWAFEIGKGLAGIDHHSGEELSRLRDEVVTLRAERERAQVVANTADSLLKAEHATQEQLAAQIRELEAQNLSLKSDLGFFEKLMPAHASDTLSVRGLQAAVAAPGQVKYQMIVMQHARASADFQGSYDITLKGTMDGKTWSVAMPGGSQPLGFRQYQRVEGVIAYPQAAVVQEMQVRVVDAKGGLKATQSLRMPERSAS